LSPQLRIHGSGPPGLHHNLAPPPHGVGQPVTVYGKAAPPGQSLNGQKGGAGPY